MVFIMLLVVFNPVFPAMNVKAVQTGYIPTGNEVNFRSGPGTSYSIIKDSNGANIVLTGGQEFEVLGSEKGSDYTWYKVKTTYNGKEYTGYLCADYIRINAPVEDEPEGEDEEDTPSDDADFEAELTEQGFPVSYKKMLRKLHEKYPEWKFEAIQTGISWDTLVENEVNRPGQVKNLVWTSSAYPHYNWRSTVVGYDWAKDTWSAYDGSIWFAASDDLVKYYLDPRTYLYEDYIFLFESLSYQDGVQTKAGVEAILKGTFMYKTVPDGEKKTYSQLIVSAGKNAGVSPYHIASRIRLEMGTKAGAAASGTNATYPGIYNFYNIGAYDGSNAVLSGLKWAATSGSYGRPWDSVKKSLYGGAEFLGKSYINVGQDTLYTQKFNVTNKGSLFSHQYMTNVQAPSTECLTNYNAYKDNDLLSTAMVFKIPVYKNMPQKAVKKPADSGNPNNWLKSLSVSDYTLTPTFKVSKTTEYSLIVPQNVSDVNISATTVNSKATISGTGRISLSMGDNNIEISVKAQNGDVRKYTLNIVRGSSSGKPNNTKYTVKDGYLLGVEAGTKAADFLTKFNVSGAKITTAKGATRTKTVRTGDIVTYSGTTATVVVTGDVNGDGAAGIADLVYMRKHILGKTKLKKEFLMASDIDGNGTTSVADLVKLKKKILGL